METLRFGTEGVGFVVSGLRSRFGIFGADFEVKDPGSWFQYLGGLVTLYMGVSSS